EQVIRLFDKAAIASSIAIADESVDRNKDPLLWLNWLFFEELVKVGRFLRLIVFNKQPPNYDAAVTGYHDFLLPFVKSVRLLLGKWSAPIYILLDDADRLTKTGQQIVNTWVANRDQRDLCIKVSARREGYLTFNTRDSVEIE
ncbi:hypothetical protein MUP77_17440, partial [Candidatus Bathyarchaeota archaeon]|nr:hypothetical protein [Candidatus Bathyarchaeota archaeon]